MIQTTTTINGLRLVSPEEVGKGNKDIEGLHVGAVIMRDGKPRGYFTEDNAIVVYPGAYRLIDLPKPRTTRPYKRGEVKLGWMFRNIATGSDNMVTRVDDCGVWFSESCVDYAMLLKNYLRLTYDSEGREVLSEAGQVEE